MKVEASTALRLFLRRRCFLTCDSAKSEMKRSCLKAIGDRGCACCVVNS